MALRGSSGPMIRPFRGLAAPWPLWGVLVTLVVGFLLGAHQRDAFDGFTIPFSYIYWILRLGMAYLLFAGALALLELSPLAARVSWRWLALAAALLTLPLFTLCVTMLDLLLGLPELGTSNLASGDFGLDSSGAVLSAGAMVKLFGMESLYHLDNHLAFCALVVVPRLLQETVSESRADAAGDAAPSTASPALHAVPLAASVMLRPQSPAAPAFLERFDPPVKGNVLAVQAQEHYVRVITSEGAQTTLYRFGDALRELEGLSGVQVHRSFWVADGGVASLKNGRRGLRIVLRNGEQVPVSARHADMVQRRYGARLETVA